MYVITLTAKTRTLFAKEATLRLAKERVTNEFHDNPDFTHASIYDQSTRCEIERSRNHDWRKIDLAAQSKGSEVYMNDCANRVHDVTVDNLPFVYAVRIFLKDGYAPMAELALGAGGRPSGDTVIIHWDDVTERGRYVINAYTFIWDEREVVREKTFCEYINRPERNGWRKPA